MPCYDPSPTRRDEKAVEVAKLCCYVIKYLNLNPVKDIENISKQSSYGAIGQEKHLDNLTAFLCKILRELKITDSNKFDLLVYNAKIKESRDLANWWEEHEKFDEKRKV